jgi:expansin (peptidoglycan-binding protein)
VRITDIHGQVLQDKFTSPSGSIPNQVQNGTAVPYESQGMIQLPLCGM